LKPDSDGTGGEGLDDVTKLPPGTTKTTENLTFTIVSGLDQFDADPKTTYPCRIRIQRKDAPKTFDLDVDIYVDRRDDDYPSKKKLTPQQAKANHESVNTTIYYYFTNDYVSKRNAFTVSGGPTNENIITFSWAWKP
jgi:hypothetical protein